MNKLKLLTVCFSAALCALDVDAMLSRMMREQKVIDASKAARGSASTVEELSRLPNDDMTPALKKDIRMAAIKKSPQTQLPSDMYKGKDGIHLNNANAIGTNLMVVLTQGVGQPGNGDAVSQALQRLYDVIFTAARIDDLANAVRVGTVANFSQDVGVILAGGAGYDTTQYLLAFSEILQAGRNGNNDFSNIGAAVMPAVKHFIIEMIHVATAEELGLL